MAANFPKGQQVSWDLGRGHAIGYVADRFERKVMRRLKDGLVTRYGTSEDPVYLITQADGTEVLILGSELANVS